MDRKLFFNILAGLIFFAACNLAIANPAPAPDHDDDMQNDDYDYGSLDGGSDSRSTVASSAPRTIPYFKENNLTVSTIMGKNATLPCSVLDLSDNSVVMWYKDDVLLTTGSQVLKPDYDINRKNFSLTVINASEASSGAYHCMIVPQQIRQQTTLIVSEHPIEAIIPESSTSAQESLYFSSQLALLMSSVIGSFLCLRI